MVLGEFKIAVLAIHSVNLKIYYSLFRARSDDFNLSERKLHDIKKPCIPFFEDLVTL